MIPVRGKYSSLLHQRSYFRLLCKCKKDLILIEEIDYREMMGLHGKDKLSRAI